MNRRRAVFAGLTLALALVVTAGAGAEPQSTAGDRRAAGAPPLRIVSTSPSITETLFALGLGPRVVGVSTYCRFPQEVAVLPKIGSFLKPDAEAIAALRPDLVFLHTGPHSASTQLAALRIRTTAVDRGGLADTLATIRQIAAAAGAAARGETLHAELTAALDRVRGAVAGRPPRRVLIVVGRRTGTLSDIVAVGPNSYLSEIAAIAGGVNVLAASRLEYPHISMETVITLAPDVIIDIGEMGESPADSERRRAVTESLWRRQTLVKAVRDGHVHAVHDEAFVVPGPRIVNAARMMARWFHGVEVR